eukprot:COSAG02_NODE_565_length_20246_cov_13.930163_8_plen_50_part_00
MGRGADGQKIGTLTDIVGSSMHQRQSRTKASQPGQAHAFGEQAFMPAEQ